MKILRILDFDDTIFSREEQLEKEELLRLNRGDAGNKIIIEQFWTNNFTEKYYKNKVFPKNLFEKNSDIHICIITAWNQDLQRAKLNACNLGDFPVIITDNGAEKIPALLRYIKESNFSPEVIEIYEDRPEYFMKYRDLLEDILGITLKIMKVEMDGNRGYQRIEEI